MAASALAESGRPVGKMNERTASLHVSAVKGSTVKTSKQGSPAAIPVFGKIRNTLDPALLS